MKAKGTYTVKKWEESTYRQITPEKKMTKASVEYGFTGEINGKGSVEYLMFYSHSDPKDPARLRCFLRRTYLFRRDCVGKIGNLCARKASARFEAGSAKSKLKNCQQTQAPPNSKAFMETEYISPIKKVVRLSWNTISNNGFRFRNQSSSIAHVEQRTIKKCQQLLMNICGRCCPKRRAILSLF